MIERTPEQQAYIVATVARMKAEILENMKSGRLPVTVSGFGALHDHVDANEYGGLCEDSDSTGRKGLDLMRSLFPDPKGAPEHDTINSQAGMDVAEEMQESVDAWLASGEYLKNLPRYMVEFPSFGPLNVALPEGWIDESWHNDSMPHFTKGRLELWTNFADEKDREMRGGRFLLYENIGDVGDAGTNMRHLLDTDDWAAMLACIEANQVLAEMPVPERDPGGEPISRDSSG